MTTVRAIHFMLLLCNILIYYNFSNATVLRRSCGAELSKRIAKVCEDYGGYNSPRGQHHRVRRRVVDECCKKVCSDSVISLYCYSSSEKVPRAAEETQQLPPDPEPQYYNDESATSDNIKESNYRPMRIGTVAPEYTRIAMSPPLYRLSYYKVME